MNIIKALLFAGLVALAIFFIIVWIIPILTFLIIFAGIALISYVILNESDTTDRPPR
jgi:hypothetical protein